MNYNIFKSNKCSIISKDHNGITFVVDSNLPDPKNELWFREGKDLEQEIIESSDIINKEKPCLTSSFRNDKLGWVGTDVLYKCIIDANEVKYESKSLTICLSSVIILLGLYIK